MLQKALSEASADKIEPFVAMRGEPFVILQQLRGLPVLSPHQAAQATLDQLDVLFGYLQAYGVLAHVRFDLSLARGLDYYSGAIYEAVLTDTDHVGSIAAGGRYDRLVGMFLPSDKQIPAVGLSIGIERIFTIIQVFILILFFRIFHVFL
jgi:histidyl-tRNA synthetase